MNYKLVIAEWMTPLRSKGTNYEIEEGRLVPHLVPFSLNKEEVTEWLFSKHAFRQCHYIVCYGSIDIPEGSFVLDYFEKEIEATGFENRKKQRTRLNTLWLLVPETSIKG